MKFFKTKKEIEIKHSNSENILENATSVMDQTEDIEKMVEGKTIKSLSTNGFGTIIHFTDGTTFTSIYGNVSYDGFIDMKID